MPATPTSNQAKKQVGRSAPRKEDGRLLRGEGKFGADKQFPRMVHARIVRSSIAHGRLISLNVDAAREAPGVIDVVTAQDLGEDLRIPVRLKVQDIELDEHLQPVLARDRVRYVGEPVAVVIAEDRCKVEVAAEIVQIDVAEHDVVLGVDAMDQADAVARFDLGFGDVDTAFDTAAHTVSLDFAVGRHTAVPMEPRALVVDYARDTGALDVYGATKVPVFNRAVLARLMQMDQSAIRMHAVDAGGGLGVRGEFYPEDFLIPWLARRLRRPVSWTEDRSEHLMAVNHSREQRHRIEIAFDAEGVILGMRDDVRHDNGAYVRTHGIIVPELTLAMLPGPYRVPAYRGEVGVFLTNKTPCGTYRAPGRFEGTTVREQALDKAADELGIDRIELRRKNLLSTEELPHPRAMSALGTDMVLDSGDYIGLLDTAMNDAQERGWLDEVDSARDRGRRVGLGVSMFLEKSGLGPHDTADVEITNSGRVRVHSGGTSLGQGIETVLAQIVADELAVQIDAVDVINGDTLLQPYGTGSWASRSTVVAGNAVRGAGEKVALRLMELGAQMLEVSVDDVELADGSVHVRGVPSKALSFAEVWAAAQPGSRWLRPQEPAGLAARYQFDVDHMTYPYGAHVCVAEVDPGTGGVRILRYLVAYEVGHAVNPELVEGQLLGGVAQGVGGALLEEFSYDDAGQPQATTFMDYLMPTASEIPWVDTVICEDAPANTNPLGAKGAGEGGLTGSGAAIASAVSHALGVASVASVPIKPAELLAHGMPKESVTMTAGR